MAGFRLPGPLNQQERFLRVKDGTMALTAMPWNGPIGQDPSPGLAPSATEEREAFLAQNSAVWEQILSGKLEQIQAAKQVLADAESAFEWGMNTPFAASLLKEIQSQIPPYVQVQSPVQALRYLPRVRQSLYVLQVLFEIYNQLCKDEFDKLDDSLKPSFDNPIAYLGVRFKEKWQYYQWLRPYYYRAGITDPVSALNAPEIEPVLFLGREVVGGVNKRMREILKGAEQELDRMGVKAQVTKAIQGKPVGFVPRPINSPKGMVDLSNHALGQAIDIDPGTNPDIQGMSAKDIDEVLAYLKVPYRFRESFLEAADLAQKPEDQVAVAYKKVLAISAAIQAFLRDWLDRWDAWEAQSHTDLTKLKDLQKREDQQRAARDKQIGMDKSYVKFQEESQKLQLAMQKTFDEQKLIKEHGEWFKANEEPLIYIEILVRALGGINNARTYREKGMVTLPPQLFVAMKKAGARSGALDYEHKKDIMHFEVPPAAKTARP